MFMHQNVARPSFPSSWRYISRQFLTKNLRGISNCKYPRLIRFIYDLNLNGQASQSGPQNIDGRNQNALQLWTQLLSNSIKFSLHFTLLLKSTLEFAVLDCHRCILEVVGEMSKNVRKCPLRVIAVELSKSTEPSSKRSNIVHQFKLFPVSVI